MMHFLEDQGSIIITGFTDRGPGARSSLGPMLLLLLLKIIFFLEGSNAFFKSDLCNQKFGPLLGTNSNDFLYFFCLGGGVDRVYPLL